ncbi:MAG TPA: fused MFS/spermidine synthase [Xanthobacteraceae bacterium]|nr:fused MFS/spermidine synthase [Xanthobacteraceae bacterium]
MTRPSLLPAFALLASLALAPPAQAQSVSLRLVERVESLYNDIYVHERPDGYMMLSFGARRLNYIESIVNPADEMELPAYYTQSMTVGAAYADKLESAVMIGLGGGRTSWYLHKSIPELKLTAVDLDPQVVRVTAQYFNVKPEQNFDIVVLDGRMYLARNHKTFDMILVDAYRGPFVPFHLLTKEFYGLIKERLNPGGAMVQNVEPSTMLFDAAVATIGAVFPNVDFYRSSGNIVIVGYDGPRRKWDDLERVAKERQEKYKFRYDLTELLLRRYQPVWNKSRKPLTDDFAPVEYLKAIERNNEKKS